MVTIKSGQVFLHTGCGYSSVSIVDADTGSIKSTRIESAQDALQTFLDLRRLINPKAPITEVI